MNNNVKNLLKNTALFGIANMGSRFLVFLMVPLYTYVLTKEEYGISDLVQSTSSFLYPLLTLMVSEAVLRYAFLKNEFDIRQVFTFGCKVTVFGVIASVIIVLIYSFYTTSALGVYIFFVPAMMATTSLSQLMHKFSRGINQVQTSAVAGFISTVSIIILNLLFLLWFKWGILGFLIAYTCGDLFAFIYIFCRIRAWTYFSKDRNVSLEHQMLKYSVPLAPNSLSWWALSCFNRYIILAVLGIETVGIYSASLRIPTMLTAIADIFSQAWLLSALKDYGTDESKVFIKSMHNRYVSFLMIVTSLFIILAYPLAKVLLSGDFILYWWIIPFLFISVIYGSLVGFLGSIYCAERKNTIQVLSTVIGAGASILLTIILISKVGVLAVAISTLVGYYIIWFIRRIAVRKYIDIGYGWFPVSLRASILILEAIFVANEMYFAAFGSFVITLCVSAKDVGPVIFSLGSLLKKKFNFG